MYLYNYITMYLYNYITMYLFIYLFYFISFHFNSKAILKILRIQKIIFRLMLYIERLTLYI